MVVKIGPVPSHIAREWCENSHRIVAAVKQHNHQLSIDVRPDMLDLCESLLVIWETIAARRDPFDWSMDVEPHMLEYVAAQWLAIGSLTDAELDLLGVTWAAPSTAPMANAVARGVAAGLAELGERADTLLNRINFR